MKYSYSTGVVCCLIATISWGGTFPVMTDALRHIDPFTFTTLRYGFAGLALFIALFIIEGKDGFNLKGERYILTWILGTAGFVGFGFCVFLGQQMAGPKGALTASIMMATMPMLGVLVNWAVRKVAPPFVSILLICMSFFGVITVITKGYYGSLFESPSSYKANLLIITGAFCWVIYTVGASFFPKWSPYKYTALTTGLGMISIIILNLLIYIVRITPVPSLDSFIYVIPHVFYTSIIAGFIGILCWNIGNKALTTMNGVLFMDVVPITAFIISSIIGINPDFSEISGACITGSALILNNCYLRYKDSIHSFSKKILVNQ
jgi:drug/metabolite transporter (DMT)-like permease